MTLKSLGFGLDLSKCVVSGSKKELKFVSPKSGCAVSRKSSIGWENKLLVLPEFLDIGNASTDISKIDLENGFKLTEYFIRKYLQPVRRLEIEPFMKLRNRVLLNNSV